jgi:hypothetical protein
LEDPSSQQGVIFCLAALCDGGTNDCHQYGDQKDGSFTPFAGKGAIEGTRVIIQSGILPTSASDKQDITSDEKDD